MPVNVGNLFLHEGRLSQTQLDEADAWSRDRAREVISAAAPRQSETAWTS